MQNLLNPYINLFDDLIPTAKFEDSAKFKRYKVVDSSTASRFTPHNIYIIDKTNYDESLKAINSHKTQSQESTKENILVFISEKIDCEIRLQKPNNAYLYLVSVEGNSFDCSLLNNPLCECDRANDECELFLYSDDSIVSLATDKLKLLDSKNAESNGFFYYFDNNALKISDSNQTLFTLTNFKTHIKKTDSNQYILDSMLHKDRFYSTLGIELQTTMEQDSFSNNGNFTINISDINLKDIESKSNFTKDSPLFCYYSQTITMTRLDSDFISLKINIDSSVKKDFNGNLLPLNPTLIFLSFIPFQNSIEANITNAQKLQLLSEDLDRKYKDIRFKIPLLRLQDSATFKEWEISQDKSQHK